MTTRKNAPSQQRDGKLRFSRRRFTSAMAGAVAITATGFLRGETNGRRYRFVVSPNSYPGFADVAQFFELVKKTPIRAIELPAGTDGSKNLIPEWMVDVSLGGRWRNSLPDLKQLLVDSGLRVECVGMAGYMGYPGSERIITSRIDFARQLGAKLLNIACEPAIVKKHRAFCYRMLRDVGKYAAKHHIRIALETWGGITRNAEESLRTMREVRLDNVGINFDTGNVLLGNPEMDAGDLHGELRRLNKHILYIHLKDVRRRPNAKALTTVLGQGEIDFRKIFVTLYDCGYNGPIGFDLETTRSAQAHDIRECHKDLLASIEYLRSIGEFDT